jgi:hypothetical protein
MNVQRSRETREDEEGRIPAAAFDATQVREVNLRFKGKLFLSHAAHQAKLAHPLADMYPPIHRPMERRKVYSL